MWRDDTKCSPTECRVSLGGRLTCMLIDSGVDNKVRALHFHAFRSKLPPEQRDFYTTFIQKGSGKVCYNEPSFVVMV